MHITVNGTRLWFDVDGPALVPDGAAMRQRPAVVLVHGGPASYDHSYFKPYFGRLADVVQVIYLDLRDHGRSGRSDPARWSFETCADDVRAFCDALGIERPIVLGHSMGGFVVMLYGARHPGHAGGLILLSTMAQFDLDRLVADFGRRGGDEVAEIARRSYSGKPVTEAEWAKVYAAFGPHVPSPDALARRLGNPSVAERGAELLRRLDIVAELSRITSPTLIAVGSVDPVTPVSCARQILEAMNPEVARLELIEGAGHFPWLDEPERHWSMITDFTRSALQK